MRHDGRALKQLPGQIDDNFLKIFNFPFVRGDPETALLQTYTAVVTRKAAERLFGNQDPIGKVATVEERYYGGDYKITGVLEDPPPNSSIRFDLLHATDART